MHWDGRTYGLADAFPGSLTLEFVGSGAYITQKERAGHNTYWTDKTQTLKFATVRELEQFIESLSWSLEARNRYIESLVDDK